jgi:ferric-dicitrate binding protein FerR (iron transport regulator)
MPAGKLHCYHTNAERCSRWASEATSDEHRQAFLHLAGVWTGLALIEEQQRLKAARLPVVVRATHRFTSANIPQPISVHLEGREEAA